MKSMHTLLVAVIALLHAWPDSSAEADENSAIVLTFEKAETAGIDGRLGDTPLVAYHVALLYPTPCRRCLPSGIRRPDWCLLARPLPAQTWCG